MDCRDNRQHRIRHQQVAPFYSGAMARIYSGVDTSRFAMVHRLHLHVQLTPARMHVETNKARGREYRDRLYERHSKDVWLRPL